MIPTMILFGLVLGRWWHAALALAALLWPALLLTDGTLSSAPEVFGAAALAVLNTGVGVLVHQAVLQAVRKWA